MGRLFKALALILIMVLIFRACMDEGYKEFQTQSVSDLNEGDKTWIPFNESFFAKVLWVQLKTHPSDHDFKIRIRFNGGMSIEELKTHSKIGNWELIDCQSLVRSPECNEFKNRPAQLYHSIVEKNEHGLSEAWVIDLEQGSLVGGSPYPFQVKFSKFDEGN